MPTYEYNCPACNSTYELREGFSAPTTHLCAECGKGTAKRVLHAPPVVFKGSGWYITDSRKSSAAAVSDGDAKGDKAEKAEKAEKADVAAKPDSTRNDSPAPAASSNSTGSSDTTAAAAS